MLNALLLSQIAMVYYFNTQWKQFKVDFRVNKGDYWVRSIISKVYCAKGFFSRHHSTDPTRFSDQPGVLEAFVIFLDDAES